MKTGLLLRLLGLSALCCTALADDAQQPVITSIRREQSNIVVVAQGPAGIRCVTLESRARLGAGAWEPRAITRLDGGGGTTTFRVAYSRQLELLRVRADANEPLPAAFYTGTNTFAGEPGTAAGPGGFVGTPDANGPGRSGPEPSRDVVESDIWKRRGETLYFFNQYRGLQVIDLDALDHPVVTGTLPLPASGEDLYLLGENHVVLLARNGCYYNNGQESQVLIVRDTAGIPTTVASLPLPGYIMESRLVGTALYVASQYYRATPGTNGIAVYEWGTVVSSFDLSDPALPVARDTLWYSGYGNVVTATEHYLFVSTTDPGNWRQSVVRIIDITDPDGTMRATGVVRTAGLIRDKFKIDHNTSRDALTTISDYWDTTRLVTKLETFRLALPMPDVSNAVAKLGELTLGQSEQLHATRFDGDRVYVVTFHVQFRIDPLWIVDLSDPARPTITGQLEIPGWSTYLQPLGDRLVALGIETNRTTVSLFNVADPAAPVLLSRVYLGTGWSWSEANWDEKAFNVLPEENLILVPFQSWTSNGYIVRVQLIDLETNSLTMRGAIDHQFQARRAMVYQTRIFSVSGRELFGVDFSDRDNPVVRSSLELAWPVDRLFVQGNYLIEVAGGGQSWGWWWDWWSPGQGQPIIRVAATDAPDRILDTVRLRELGLAGVTRQGNYLYVMQGMATPFYPWLAYYGNGAQTESSNSSPIVLTVLDLTRLPQISVLAEVETKAEQPFLGNDLQALWPRPGLLVWAGGGFDWWLAPYPVAVDVAGPGFAPWPWFWPSSRGLLVAFDVSAPTAPTFASSINVTGSNWWNSGNAFAARGLVYLSHQYSEFVEGLDSPWRSPAYTNIYVDEKGATVTNFMPAGSWVTKSYLDVVDYADAAHPTLREPVSISGQLQGISHEGSLLYITREEWSRNGSNFVSYTPKLDALAYDGVAAHFVDSLALPNNWPRPLLVAGNHLFLGVSSYNQTNQNPHYLETWTVSDAARFTQLGRLVLTSPATALQDFPGMLVMQDDQGALVLFDRADPANLRRIGQGRPNGCFWFDLRHADGNVTDGLWLPLGGFGVSHVPVGP
jgi:hypothetical protein